MLPAQILVCPVLPQGMKNTVNHFIFHCLTLISFRNDLLPLIPSGESHFTSKLSVRVEKGPDFVATNFTFFDCNTYSSCTTCVSSLFPCDWCVDGKLKASPNMQNQFLKSNFLQATDVLMTLLKTAETTSL